MRKFKKTLMACLIAVFALTLGAGLGFMPKNTAKAAVATEYTVVEKTMMAGIQNCHAAGGNLNFFLTIPGIDNEVDGDGITFEGVDLAQVFNEFGFFDNVMIGGKTLRELGCTSFWDNTLGYNIGEPKPRIYLHTHFDPEILAAAIADGTVNYEHMTMSNITIKEGTMIPGYRYLKGLDNAVVYKAGCDYETSVDSFAFERKLVGKTEVNSLKYIQDNKDGTGYFGVSLYGDDFIGAGVTDDTVAANIATSITGWYYDNTILLNGETGKVEQYSLINLGSKGVGYYAFYAKVSEAELTSVTIPAGTKIPMYFYRGPQGSAHYNSGNKVVSYFEVQTTKTFVKDSFGNWVAEGATSEIETEVTMVNTALNGGKTSDFFLTFELSVNDYAGLNTYAGTAISARDFVTTSNFTSHVLINDEPYPTTGETYLNVWGIPNVLSTRCYQGAVGFTDSTQVNKITILAGCQFPSYEMLENGAAKYYVTTEDVTFVKVEEQVWEKQGAFDLDEYKAEKLVEVEAYKAGMFLEEQEAERQLYIQTVKDEFENFTTKEEVDALVAEFKSAVDELPTVDDFFDLDVYKAEMTAEVEAYKAGMFLEEQEAERQSYIQVVKDELVNRATKEDVDALVAEFKSAVDELPTKGEILEEQLRGLKEAAKAELDAYLADGDLNGLQIIDRSSAVSQGKDIIENAMSEDEIANALEDAKALVDDALAREVNYVDVTAIVKVTDCYKAGGNFYVYVVFEGVDADPGEYAYDVKVGDVLDALGFWDNVYVGDKSLKEWGVTGGWDNDDVIGYNCGEPQNNVYIHCRSEEWKNSDVTFANGIVSNYDMTIKEGTLIPSKAYFDGDDSYDVYRVKFEMVSNSATIAYDFKGYAETDVVDVQLAQDNGDSVYLAVGLSNNDYPSASEYVEVADLYYGDDFNKTAYWVNVKVNGDNGIGKYAIYNLNDGGHGRIALTVSMPYAQVNSITIPAGTIFPTYAMQTLKSINGGNVLVIVLKTTKDVTFVKTASGAWVNFDGYKANAIETLNNAISEIVEEEYFEDDYWNTYYAYEDSIYAIEDATDVETIDEALASGLLAINSIEKKASYVAAAKEDVASYKAGMFREAEEAERLNLVAMAYEVFDGCASREDIDANLKAAKEVIDGLKTAAQYADEELAEVKASAREEIANYLDLNNYYADEQAEIALAIEAGHLGVANATNEAEIAQAVLDAKAALDAILVKEEVVAQIKADLNAYKAEDGYFLAEEKAQRDTIVANALVALEGITDKAEIDAIVADAKAAIDALASADDHLEAELAELKANAKAEIEAYLADGDYIPSQEANRLLAVEWALEALANAKSAEAIAQVVADAKLEIDEIAASVTVVDTAMMVKISDIYHAGGNLNMFVIIPGLDLPEVAGDEYSFGSKEALEALFDEFGLYDMVYINDKSLREWGFVGFWNGAVGFNVDAPNPAIYLHMHTDNPDYAAAVESGEITFTSYEGTGALVIAQSPITVKEGLLIPGYSYLSGAETSIVYRASADFVTEGAARPYDLEANGYTDVDSIVYVQEDRDQETGEFQGFGYLGFSLYGDDYLAFEGDNIEINNVIINYVNYDGILINGEAGLVNKYALYNLGEKGKGYLSVQITIAEADMYSVTIPAGTIFPAYATSLFPSANDGNMVFVLFRTTNEVTFVKTATGAWVKFDDYVQSARDTLNDLASSKEGLDCFEADVEAIATTVANAQLALDNATTLAEVDAILADAKAILDAIQAKDVVIANAKADLDAYKAEAFLEAEEASRLAIIANAKVAIDNAISSEAVIAIVADAKAEIDLLKTANEYAKEAIAEDVANAKADLDAYKAEDGLYREEQANERLTIIANAKALLDEAISLEEVNAIVVAAKASIDELKTDAELNADEDLAIVKEEAIKGLNEFKASIDLTLYSSENVRVISNLFKDAKTAIEEAKSSDEIAEILLKCAEDFEKIPQGGVESEDKEDNNNDSSEEISGGCFGGIGGASSVFALLGVMAVAVLLKKKRA